MSAATGSPTVPAAECTAAEAENTVVEVAVAAVAAAHIESTAVVAADPGQLARARAASKHLVVRERPWAGKVAAAVAARKAMEEVG